MNFLPRYFASFSSPASRASDPKGSIDAIDVAWTSCRKGELTKVSRNNTGNRTHFCLPIRLAPWQLLSCITVNTLLSAPGRTQVGQYGCGWTFIQFFGPNEPEAIQHRDVYRGSPRNLLFFQQVRGFKVAYHYDLPSQECSLKSSSGSATMFGHSHVSIVDVSGLTRVYWKKIAHHSGRSRNVHADCACVT